MHRPERVVVVAVWGASILVDFYIVDPADSSGPTAADAARAMEGVQSIGSWTVVVDEAEQEVTAGDSKIGRWDKIRVPAGLQTKGWLTYVIVVGV
eukprot:SAG31_NODE_14247_length_818_cov_1.618915_2_plen_94_part_01